MPKQREALIREYEGRRFRVVHCDGAAESYQDALNHVRSGRAASFTRGIVLQIKRLADGLPMSRENFPREGALPRQPGQQGTKYFNALKKIPIRGYCWRSATKPNTYFISHYVYKDYDDLAERDVQKVGHNWRRIEESGDDY